MCKDSILSGKNLEMLTDSRVKREREYHDRYFAEGNREPTQKFYHVFGASTEHYERQLTELGGTGKRALEYGCGDGQWSYAYFLAERGADVTGIDISDVAIQLAQKEADRRGLRKAKFQMMNAEQMEFADSSFDLICGSAILHHLDLERSYAELARVLTPDGAAVFSEPLGHNPAINWYRHRTPELRTPDEHPLRMGDVRLAQEYFGRVEMKSFYLLSLMGVPFRNATWFPRLRSFLNRADRVLFRLVPFIARYAWIGILVLKEPRKHD